MTTCPNCGHDNEPGARFCSQCATPLQEAAATREERKVVTCLFCDLVGFTARAEQLDPEDVRAVLQPYHAQVRAELERFGGTVEKFIGDAVMAVFGAPVAHEDDPERAVRAALAIRDTLGEEQLDVRIGITTGEALITLGARPEAGEGMAAGDVVNTAARLQSAAATNAILVDETTYRATERAIDYREAPAVEAKGKAEPVNVWQAAAARARVGVERVGGAELVGRERELELLRGTFARVLEERTPQLVTLVGVPGIGKSRLVYELFQAIETGDFGLVRWRHGRSLPYGEGVTFWALAEIVKAQAGVLESDDPDEVAAKLRRAVETAVSDGSEASWIEGHLRPLAGLETGGTHADDRRDEAFAAWRRYVEALAEERPLVLVFEDLHWADDQLLDFVDYVVEWAGGVPLLVLCTARPELLERRQDWGGGKANASTLQLSPLSSDQTSVLVHRLIGRGAIDATLQAELLERAGGNPLYAEEFARMVTERPAETVLPESVQGIIAARLDTLALDEKRLLQEAAVVGRTFWLGALGGERWQLEEQLHSLERKEFLSRERRSTVAGEAEYSFGHALVRDVAYEQIPRAQRPDKHLAAAAWIESLGRPDDHAEMLAHHYAAALDFARATGRTDERLTERGRKALRDAGDRAFALNAFASAARYYQLAVELWPADDVDRADLLFHLARAHHVTADERQQQSLEEAREALLIAGRVEQAAEADALLAEVWWYRGDREQCDRLLERASQGVAPLPDSAAKARVLGQISRYRMLAGEFAESIRIGEEALLMAADLGLDVVRAGALNNVGVSRAQLGDERGLEELERSAEIALAARSTEAIRALNNLGAVHASLGDFVRSGEYFAEAVRVGEELGAPSLTQFSRAQLAGNLLWAGRWDEGLRLVEICLSQNTDSVSMVLNLKRNRARVLLALDDVEGALDDVREVLMRARKVKDPQFLIPALGMAARIQLELGRREEALALATELLHEANRVGDWRMVDIVFAARPLGLAERVSPTDRGASAVEDARGEPRRHLRGLRPCSRPLYGSGPAVGCRRCTSAPR